MTETSPRRALIYCRISEDRTGAGLGVERQEADCRALADRLGYTVIDVLTDNDTSAYKGKRRRYEELLTALQRGAGDAVLAWHSDRLHRQPAELERFIEVVEAHGVVVHFAQSGPVDLATPSGRLQARIAGAVARHESEHKAARVSAARKQMAQTGKWSGGVRPFGYTANGTELNPAEADGIRRGYDMLLHGGTLRGVMRMLNEAQLRTTRESKEWESSTLRNMLMRPRNAGLAVHQKRIVGPGNWPAIVTQDELAAVTDLLSSKDRRTTSGNKPRWLGSLIYQCGVCGDVMVVGTGGYPSRRAYLCRAQNRGGRAHISRTVSAVDGFVEFMLIRRLQDPAYAEKFKIEHEPRVDVAPLRRKLATLERLGVSMSRRLGDEEISEEEFDEFIAANRARIRALETQLRVATIKNPVTDIIATGDVQATWERYTIDEKRAVLRGVFRVTIMPAKNTGGVFDPSRIKLDPA